MLSERFLRGARNDDVPFALCNAVDFAERLICLEVTGSQWESWRTFLHGYARAYQAGPIHQRSLFMVSVSGTPQGALPAAGTAKVFEWDDVIDEADILAFANDRLRRKGKTRPVASLLAAAVSSIAAWDFETASRLLEERDQTILHPVEMLRSWGREKGLGQPYANFMGHGYGIARRDAPCCAVGDGRPTHGDTPAAMGCPDFGSVAEDRSPAHVYRKGQLA